MKDIPRGLASVTPRTNFVDGFFQLYPPRFQSCHNFFTLPSKELFAINAGDDYLAQPWPNLL